MPTIKTSVAVGAGVTINNVLSGSNFETVTEPGEVQIGLLASAPGLQVGVSSGGDILLEDGSTVDVVRVANQGPLYPDDFLLTDAVLPQDKLKIRAVNPTGGSITLFYGVQTRPAQ